MSFLEKPHTSAPLKQGDIFFPLPYPIVDIGDMTTLDDDGPIEFDWNNTISPEPMDFLIKMKPVYAIVASQDCDNLRDEAITFFMIKTFRDLNKKNITEKNVRDRVDQIISITKGSPNAIYIPPDSTFPEPMLIDMSVTFQVRRTSLLDNLATLRIGRLASIAYENYRDKIANFFRRYPSNEWYAMSKEEFNYYLTERMSKASTEEKENIKPYPWQE